LAAVRVSISPRSIDSCRKSCANSNAFATATSRWLPSAMTMKDCVHTREGNHGNESSSIFRAGRGSRSNHAFRSPGSPGGSLYEQARGAPLWRISKSHRCKSRGISALLGATEASSAVSGRAVALSQMARSRRFRAALIASRMRLHLDRPETGLLGHHPHGRPGRAPSSSSPSGTAAPARSAHHAPAASPAV
jgi:hypothetical protein